MVHPCRVIVPSVCLALTACGGTSSTSPTSSPSIATAADTQPYSGIGADDTVHFTGTEPFWAGSVSGQTLTYTTPENQEGEMVVVDRLAGRNGISFSGDLDQMPFVLALTPGKCSDGMSERSYPFTVTLQVRGQQREGCAWTNKQPFSGPKQP
jgi:uncharacterized membrane protein